MRQGRCPICRAPTITITTDGGGTLAVDQTPHPDGGVVVGAGWKGTYYDPDEMVALLVGLGDQQNLIKPYRYMLHAVTCRGRANGGE